MSSNSESMKRLAIKLKSSFLKNTLLLVLSSLSRNIVLLLFWLAAAELYSQQDVGIASSVLSSLFLIELVSRLGLDYSIIRFFPEKDKCKIFNTSIIVAPSLALLLGITCVGLQYFTDLADAEPFNITSDLAFILIPFVLSAIVMLGTSFKAIHRSELSLFQNLLEILSIFLLLPLLSLGAEGIVWAYFTSLLVKLLISIAIAKRLGFRFFFGLDVDFFRDTFKFAIGNHLANLSLSAIYLILPIMVMFMLGATKTAHFTIAFNICSLLFIIPTQIGESLFIEGSCTKGLKRLVFETVTIVTAILIILSTILYFISPQLLEFAGREDLGGSYLYSLDLLRMLILSSFFVAFVSIYLSIKRIRKDTSELIVVSGLTTLMTIISCYVFMKYLGFMGVGYGWIAGYGFSFAIIGILVFREIRSGNRYS